MIVKIKLVNYFSSLLTNYKKRLVRKYVLTFEGRLHTIDQTMSLTAQHRAPQITQQAKIVALLAKIVEQEQTLKVMLFHLVGITLLRKTYQVQCITNTNNQIQVIICYLILLSLCNCRYLHVFISPIAKSFFFTRTGSKNLKFVVN